MGPQSFAKNYPTAYEAMDPPAWKQTLKDVPVSLAGMALGYGIGRTIADHVAGGLAQGARPSWLKYMPQIAAGVSSAAAFGQSRVRGILKARRDEARLQEERKLTSEYEKLRAARGVK